MKITLMPDGPLLVFGASEVNGVPIADAGITKKPIALCRCGCSDDKPLCDGSHDECEIGLPGGSIE